MTTQKRRRDAQFVLNYQLNTRCNTYKKYKKNAKDDFAIVFPAVVWEKG